MTILLMIFLIYIIGCVLAFGRAYGEFQKASAGVFFAMFSWVGFLTGSALYRYDKAFIAFPSFRKPEPIKKPKTMPDELWSKVKHLAEKPPEYDFENRVPEMYSWR